MEGDGLGKGGKRGSSACQIAHAVPYFPFPLLLLSVVEYRMGVRRGMGGREQQGEPHRKKRKL